MLKMHCFLKKIAKLWGLRPQTPAILPTPIALLQNVLILSPIKSQFWLAKFGAILVPPLFVILPLHFPWSGNGTDRIHSQGRKNGCFWGCKILILPKAIQFYLTKSAECGCIPHATPTELIESIIQINKAYKCAFLSIKCY